MGTGLLRRHRDALEKLREQDAAQEIAEVVTVVHTSELAPVDEPEPVIEPEPAVVTPNKSRRAKAQE